MSAGHSEPQVLYSIDHIRAFHLQDGQEHEITVSGPQTMTLIMVPTSSPFADLSNADPSSAAPEEDFYLHLQLPPELDQPLPATTQIYHKPPSSYLIPRWDLPPEAGAFIRIEFPSIGHGPGKVSQDDVDTFETILAQCTAFLERSAPSAGKTFAYNPADYKPGEGYVTTKEVVRPRPGQIVLIDEDDGSVVGELQGGMQIVEGPDIEHGSKHPVEIQLPEEGQESKIRISNVSEDYLARTRHPAYANSTVVQTSAKASRLIVTGSTKLAEVMTTGAETFRTKTKPTTTPMTFSPAAHDRIRKIHTFTEGARGISAKTVGAFGDKASRIGSKLMFRSEKKRSGYDKNGQVDPNFKPGILNKSMIAFSTITDGIDAAGRQLLTHGSAAAGNVVEHRFGSEARDVATSVGSGVKNVGLVYVDAAGVTRKAFIKSVAKGMVVGNMPDGSKLVVGEGDGGVVPSEAYRPDAKRMDSGGSSSGRHQKPGYGVESYGNAAYAPTPGSGLGEPLGSRPQGQQHGPY